VGWRSHQADTSSKPWSPCRRYNRGSQTIWVPLRSRCKISSTDDLERGDRVIIREGLRKIAGLPRSRHSAACTRWNSIENCWDCPCHGSIFGPEGQV
jgi:Rieske Fe-S protein